MAKRTNQGGKIKNDKKTVKSQTYSSDGEKVIWRFDKIDRNGKFAFDLSRTEFKHKLFMEKMISYNGMTWTEVKRQTHDDNKSKHHFLEISKLSKEAYDRFQELHLEQESDSIFSFALDNKLRIVGIRRNEHFHVLWYDPNHEVCPSIKKHT